MEPPSLIPALLPRLASLIDLLPFDIRRHCLSFVDIVSVLDLHLTFGQLSCSCRLRNFDVPQCGRGSPTVFCLGQHFPSNCDIKLVEFRRGQDDSGTWVPQFGPISTDELVKFIYCYFGRDPLRSPFLFTGSSAGYEIRVFTGGHLSFSGDLGGTIPVGCRDLLPLSVMRMFQLPSRCEAIRRLVLPPSILPRLVEIDEIDSEVQVQVQAIRCRLLVCAVGPSLRFVDGNSLIELTLQPDSSDPGMLVGGFAGGGMGGTPAAAAEDLDVDGVRLVQDFPLLRKVAFLSPPADAEMMIGGMTGLKASVAPFVNPDSRVKTLDWAGTLIPSSFQASFTQTNPYLQEFNVKASDVSDEEMTRLADNCPALRSVTLEGWWEDMGDFGPPGHPSPVTHVGVSNLLARSTSLRKLKVLVSLLVGLFADWEEGKVSGLKELLVESWSQSGTAFELPEGFATCCPNLETVGVLSRMPFFHGISLITETLMTSIASLPNLKTLIVDFTRNEIDSPAEYEGFSIFPHVLQASTTLRCIRALGAPVAEVLYLCENMPNLAYFDFGIQPVMSSPEEVMEQLALVIRRLSGVVHVFVRACQEVWSLDVEQLEREFRSSQMTRFVCKVERSVNMLPVCDVVQFARGIVV